MAYSFENSGNNAGSTGATHNAVLRGNVTYTPGFSGSGVRLSGSNAVVTLGSGTTGPALGSAWTLSVWFKDAAPKTGVYRTMFRGGANHHPLLANQNSDTLGAYNNSAPSGTNFKQFGSASLASIGNDGRWHHLVVVGQGGSTTLYIDGALAGVSASQSTLDVLGLGNIQSGANQRFADLVDEFLLYGSAFDASQVAALYSAYSCLLPTTTTTPSPTTTSATFVTTTTTTAPSTLQWVRLASGYNSGLASVTAVDSAGNVYMAAENSGLGVLDVNLNKYSKDGTLLWARVFGGSSKDTPKGIAIDGADNVYVAGMVFSGTFYGQNASGGDCFLVKYSSSGAMLWGRLYGGVGSDQCLGIAADGAGNVFVTGYTDSPTLDGLPVQTRDAFLTKFDTGGNRLWTQLVDAGYNGRGVALDSAGFVYVTGYTNSSTNPVNTTDYNVFLAKFNATTGAKVWSRFFGVLSYDLGRAIAIDAADNIYIAGDAKATFWDLRYETPKDFYSFIAKYDSNGNQQWIRIVGTGEYIYGASADTDSLGNVYMTGFVYGAALDGVPLPGAADAFLTQYDGSGNRVSTRVLGNAGRNEANSVAVDKKDNTIYVVGITQGTLGGAAPVPTNSTPPSWLYIAKYSLFSSPTTTTATPTTTTTTTHVCTGE